MRPYYKECFDYVNSFSPISEPLFEKMYKYSSYREVKKNTKLLNIGTVSQKIFLVANGYVRSYAIFDNGKEVTKSLYCSMMFFSCFNSVLKRLPSETIYETLTDCHIFEIDFNVFKNLCNSEAKVLNLYTKFLEYIILENEKKFLEISTSDASERYLKLRKRIKDLDTILPQFQIAACLGITPVQLSRIRSKLSTPVN